MAQKAAKTLAARNTSVLLRTHLITLALHSLFLLLHWTFNRPRSLKPYCLLACPTLAIEFYLDRLGRPAYNAADGSLRSPGEDLGAAGLTEYMWDILYWTWGCIGAACLFGDRAWWLWIVVPVYSVWLAYSTLTGVRSGLAGMGGEAEQTGGESKRQKKMEKRGGQRVQYR
ncbi:hypothetical protein P175DRAFT_0534309 [Aspergillus ochraceoroseus IBT 24754]|uniref:DUF788 domain protein n=3 Tax=Aspergillus subgen. Nidulantes TaxID=2720870 RepID=A0A0F8TWN1_9EURO|nr:uncharacterized protein P175DRAFT_0534309 [Aspergillus ochraceoroseus IBT 24754]KKK11899.1 DUF788 domain protein [Aspergillus rambellii]KKK25991.1 DUF788 domain protein [Aspergillus ochraceoroseus]PTU18567.1 hypothetical protein P175DRAFT_0534309 [Aspergillus ochraceoroseus IBT 24754]